MTDKNDSIMDALRRDDMEGFRKAVKDEGGMVTGDNLENFKRGWAKMGFKKHKAHYYVIVSGFDGISRQGRHRFYESLCGVTGECSDSAPAFDPGNFERCQNCIKLAQKKLPINKWRDE